MRKFILLFALFAAGCMTSDDTDCKDDHGVDTVRIVEVHPEKEIIGSWVASLVDTGTDGFGSGKLINFSLNIDKGGSYNYDVRTTDWPLGPQSQKRYTQTGTWLATESGDSKDIRFQGDECIDDNIHVVCGSGVGGEFGTPVRVDIIDWKWRIFLRFNSASKIMVFSKGM